jgi:hypothetical protein
LRSKARRLKEKKRKGVSLRAELAEIGGLKTAKKPKNYFLCILRY